MAVTASHLEARVVLVRGEQEVLWLDVPDHHAPRMALHGMGTTANGGWRAWAPYLKDHTAEAAECCVVLHHALP